MRHYLLLLFIAFSMCFTSCRDDFEFEPSTGDLEFSRDTVYLDTVFTNIGSSTYTLKVYNRSNKDITIPSLRLGQGENSKYRLMVDGIPGRVFNDVELLAKDSMFVFIETTIDYSEFEGEDGAFLYTDKIEFDSGANLQTVELVTLVQDAIFIKPDRPLPTDARETLTINGMESGIEGHELATPEELHWTNEKPYVVYGYAFVPNGSALTVDAGARVHFHAESGIIVDKNASLHINGALSATEEMENEVIFEGDRLEPEFAEIPGQWNGIILFSNELNSINHLTLKNSTVGILMQALDEETIVKLDIANSQLYNSRNFGILARRSQITGTNVVANNAGQASLQIELGGTYNFTHCTFANYFNSFDQKPVVVTDYLDGDGTRFVSDLDAQFTNCILYGSSNYGVLLGNEGGAETAFSYNFKNCLIKFTDFSGQFEGEYPHDFEDEAHYTNCIIAESSTQHNPKFLDPVNNNLQLGEESAATGSADPATAAATGPDILGRPRTSPDIGAYVYVPAED